MEEINVRIPQFRPLVIDVDARHRISLGRLAGDNDRFLGSVDDSTGVITLVPAEVVPRTMPVRAKRPGPSRVREP